MLAIIIGSVSLGTERPMNQMVEVSHVGLILFLELSMLYALPWVKIIEAYKYCWEHKKDPWRQGEI